MLIELFDMILNDLKILLLFFIVSFFFCYKRIHICFCLAHAPCFFNGKHLMVLC